MTERPSSSPSSLRDSGIIARPARSRARGPPDSSSPDGQLDRARGRALGAEDRARELGAPGADEPGEGHDLAGVDGEAHALHARSVQVAHGEDRRRVVGRGALGREGGRQRAAEHRVDERVLGLLGGGRRAHDAPVAQHGDLVGEREHLAQEVRDEQHRAARRRRASGRSRAAGRSPRRPATAVGSSMTMSSASRASARRISTFCCSAGARRPAGAVAGRWRPAVSASCS